MALIATVSFSKKIPVPDSEYSSQGYSLSLQTEIPETDPAAIQARLSETFQLVKDQVEHELAKNGNGSSATGRAQRRTGNGSNGGRNGGNGDSGKATNRQIKFILDLAKRQGQGLAELNTRCGEEFGVGSVYDLDRKSASQLVDQLKAA